MFEAGCCTAFISSHFQQLVMMTAWLNCLNQYLWHHSLRHSQVPGNDVCTFPIPGNEKTGPGMQTVLWITTML